MCRFFQRVGDYPSAIRFLVISGCLGDAFRLSREHKQLELYGDILAEECVDDEANEEFKSLALHFESSNKHFLAGKYYYHAKDYRKVSGICVILRTLCRHCIMIPFIILYLICESF